MYQLTYMNPKTRFPVSVFYHDLDYSVATKMQVLLQGPLYNFRTTLEKVPDGYKPYLRKNRQVYPRRPDEGADY